MSAALAEKVFIAGILGVSLGTAESGRESWRCVATSDCAVNGHAVKYL
jgi:hypothetical protein